MILTRLGFDNFRNLDNTPIDLAPGKIYLVGANAQGKTSFLEAIYVLSYGASFRTRRLDALIAHGHPAFTVRASLQDQDGLPHSLAISYRHGKKEIYYDDKKVADRKDLIQIMPSVIFSHSDFQLITGTQEQKRNFFDQLLVYDQPQYIHVLRTYKRVLRERNEALRSGRHDLLDTYDTMMSHAGAQIIACREGIIDQSQKMAKETISKVNEEQYTVGINYSPSWRGDGTPAGIMEELNKQRQRDKEHRLTTRGPHHDKISFLIDGNNIESAASTGQIRLFSLVLKIIQAKIITTATARPPFLLFDDVLLELDKNREQGVLNQLPEAAQSFFTFLNKENTTELPRPDLRLKVENGRVH